jgi:hypothetical protein
MFETALRFKPNLGAFITFQARIGAIVIDLKTAKALRLEIPPER